MGKIIVPKNEVLSSGSAYGSTISTTSVTINANISPEFIYADGSIIVQKSITYSPSGTILKTTSNVYYRINLFDSASEDNKELRFIRLTLNNFPVYQDNRTNLTSTLLATNIKIYKKSNSSTYDCQINLSQETAYATLDVNGTYWLTFNPSTKKYTISTTEPELIYKAIVPKMDNWMDSTVTPYSPPISTSMTLDLGDMCNQPYIGRVININNIPTSPTSITTSTTYKLTINTADKFLLINTINLGKFIGPQSSLSNPPTVTLTFKIFVNSNSTPVHTQSIQIKGYTTGTVGIYHAIGASSIYIDVMNNKTITSDDLYKAIDIF